MFKYLPLLLVLSCGPLFDIPSGQPQNLAPESAVMDSLSATMVMMGQDGVAYCASVVVNHLMLTAAHCVDETQPIIAGYKGKGLTVSGVDTYSVLHKDTVQDLAILQAKNHQMPRGVSIAQRAPRDGEKVVAIGHPLGLLWTITEGIVAREERMGGIHPDQHWCQVTAQITFGNSGGPIYNYFGEVVGIASFRGPEAYIGGAVHFDEIASALRKLKPQ